MIVDPQLLGSLQQTLTYEPYAGRTFDGVESYGPPQTVRCRVEGKVRMVRSVDGNETVSTTTIYLMGDGVPAVTPRDRITLADADVPTGMPKQPKILAVNAVPDLETGQTVYVAVYT